VSLLSTNKTHNDQSGVEINCTFVIEFGIFKEIIVSIFLHSLTARLQVSFNLMPDAFLNEDEWIFRHMQAERKILLFLYRPFTEACFRTGRQLLLTLQRLYSCFSHVEILRVEDVLKVLNQIHYPFKYSF
jgi:hypothetical protein